MNSAALDPAVALADGWQRNFPLCPRPFAEIARQAGMTEQGVLAAFRMLAAQRKLSRIGAVVRPNCAGASTLAAISVPPGALDEAAAAISSEPFVNHNYERDHAINLWFVVAAPDEEHLAGTLGRIARNTGRRVLDLRLIEPYHIDLGFGLLSGRVPSNGSCRASRVATVRERELLGIIEDGLPLVATPYQSIGTVMGWREAQVRELIAGMGAAGIISRFGCVLRHRELGFAANAMAVWDVDDNRVAEAGQRLAGHAGVTLCYRRNRVSPDWTYNLYAMVHGRDEQVVRGAVAELAAASRLSEVPQDILFSRRCFVQRGARFRAPNEMVAA